MSPKGLVEIPSSIESLEASPKNELLSSFENSVTRLPYGRLNEREVRYAATQPASPTSSSPVRVFRRPLRKIYPSEISMKGIIKVHDQAAQPKRVQFSTKAITPKQQQPIIKLDPATIQFLQHPQQASRQQNFKVSKTDKSLFSHPVSMNNSPESTSVIEAGVLNSARAGTLDQGRPFSARESPQLRLNGLNTSDKTLNSLILQTQESSPPTSKSKVKVTHKLNLSNLSKLRPKSNERGNSMRKENSSTRQQPVTFEPKGDGMAQIKALIKKESFASSKQVSYTAKASRKWKNINQTQVYRNRSGQNSP